MLRCVEFTLWFNNFFLIVFRGMIMQRYKKARSLPPGDKEGFDLIWFERNKIIMRKWKVVNRLL